MSARTALPRTSWRLLLGGNVLWLSAASLLNDVASEMIFPLLPFFLVGTLGASPSFLGLIEGVADTTSSLVKLWGGWLSDRLGRRRALVGWGYGIAAGTRPLIALATSPVHVLALRFADRVGKGVRTAPRDALLAESVAPARRGAAFGVHRAADHLGAVIGPLLAAGLLLWMPGRLRTVFALAAVPGLLAVVLVLWKVADRRAGATAERRAGAGGRERDTAERRVGPVASLRLVLGGGAGGLRAYLLVLVLFTLGNASDAFLLLRAEQLGVPLAAVPLLWGALHVSKSVWSVPGGLAADRWGARPAIVAGWVLYAAVYAGFALATAAWHVWALFLVYGLFYGLTEAPEKALVARLAPDALRGTAFGAYHLAIGLAALPASLLFGVLWDAFGAPVAFLAGAGVALAAAGLLVGVVRGRRPGSPEITGA